MKKMILSLVLALSPLAAFAHGHGQHDHGSEILQGSPVTAATAEVLHNFQAESLGGVLSLQTVKIDDETATALIYKNQSGASAKAGYDCHFHAHGDHQQAHCHGPADLGLVSDSAPAAAFGAEDLLASLSYSVDIFARKVAELSSLQEVKMWQVQNEVYVSLSYLGKDSSEQKSQYMCHMHGDHFDCHRSRNPGPQEPAL